MNNDLLTKLETHYKKMSKGQKRIADYIMAHYDKAAFMTASKLGSIAGVSESTVVRFASELGYDGYPALSVALQDMVRTKLTAVQRMEIASTGIDEENLLGAVLQSDMDNLRKTLETIDPETFHKSVDAINCAKNVYILGVRSSSALASFMGFYFNLMFDNVKVVHTNSVSEMFERMMRVDDRDVVIGISFPRYSKRTVQALKYAKDRNATVISITDSVGSPLVGFSDYALIARSSMASFADSLVAPLSVINALIFALGMRNKDDVYKTFEKLEGIWDEYNVYEKTK